MLHIGRKRFLCFQGKLPAAWLNALPCQSLGLKLTNSQLRNSGMVCLVVAALGGSPGTLC